MNKTDKLAEILHTRIEFHVARQIDEIFPGFYDAFCKYEDEWEKSDLNTLNSNGHKRYGKGHPNA